MISENDISVVISGPILGKVTDSVERRWTWKACKSVRTILPKAEIVLSTWEGSDYSDLDYDILVLSKDPGTNINNVNRQICSRRSGIEKASRKYVVAMRSESIMEHTNFLQFYGKYQKHGNEGYFFLNERVIIPASMPTRSRELFHMGDWYYFGQKEDLLSLWDIPYCNDTEINQQPDDIFYNAHRYLITSFIRKYRNLDFYKRKDINKKNAEIYQKVMVENFVIIGLYDYGFDSLKYPFDKSFSHKLWDFYASFTYNDWKKMYNKYCGGEETFKRSAFEILGIYFFVPYFKCYNNIKIKSGRCMDILSNMKKRILFTGDKR